MKHTDMPHLFYNRLRFFAFTLVFPLSLLSSAQTRSAAGKQRAGFLLQKGGDTLTVEGFTRSGNALEGRLLLKKEFAVAYQAALTDTRQLERLAVAVSKPGAPADTPPMQAAVLTMAGDSIYSVSHEGTSTATDTIKTTDGAMAYHPNLPMISLLEQIVMRARTIGGKEVKVPVFLLGSNGQTVVLSIRFPEPDAAQFMLGNLNVTLKVNKAGEILSGKTSDGQIITRLAAVPDAVR